MTVHGADRLIRKLTQLPVEARAGIGKALTISVVEMDGYAKQKIQGGGRSGRVYRRGRIAHQASAPGEYPKTDRGQLVASLFFQVGADKLRATFGSALAYARHLEYGTTTMAARPWLRPTFLSHKEAASRRVAGAVQDALRRAARG